MPDTKVLPLLPDYAEHEWLYCFHADIRDRAAGIPIQGPESLDLFCQEVRKCREEDGEESSEYEETKEFWEKLRRTDDLRGANAGGSGKSRGKQKKNGKGCGLTPSPIGEQRMGLPQTLTPCKRSGSVASKTVLNSLSNITYPVPRQMQC